ncbi:MULTISPECIES: hypothetical protein [Streptomyces]|uniref:hypothetical protein n=1 Tax=Streptomyces TaxID=1883 RepID=UPI001F3CA071|nr:hypothetical protein [Streptomyces olivochromogenes]MCF3134044.1 hypothetical protein [Streptomyces olivochromogenes]
MKITRRLDAPQRCATNSNCPAVFALSSGDVAFIGRVAHELHDSLPSGSGVGDGEHLVVVPRDVLISAGWTPPAG